MSKADTLSDKIKRELQLMGINPTKEQIQRIEDIKIDSKKTEIQRTLNDNQLSQAIVLCTCYANALHGLMLSVSKATIKHKLKHEYNKMMHQCERAVKEFEKANGQNARLMEAYNILAEDIFNIAMDLLDNIQNHKEK